MDNIYKYLNEVETDFSEFEEDSLSPEEVSKISSRINKKINSKKKNSSKALTWLGRAAVLALCCVAVGGTVYAATVLRKNTSDNLRIKSSQSETISEEGSKATKKIYDEETGSELTYDVYTEGNTAADKASIERISKQNSYIKMNVNIELEDISRFEPLRETFDHFVDQGVGVAINNEKFDNFSLTSKLDDTEMLSWVNNYSINENSLSIEIIIDTTTTQALNDGTDPDLPNITLDSELGPDALSDEELKALDEYNEKYNASLPDPFNSTISLDLNLGNDLGGTYTFVTKLDGFFENGSNEVHTIDGGSAKIEWYGQTEELSIDSYSIEANGLQLYGSYGKTEDQDAYEAEREKQNLFSYNENLRIRAWDDLGNTYLLIPEVGPYFFIDQVSGEPVYDTTKFVATLLDNGSYLSWYNEATGMNYCSEWADDISQITFAIERYTQSEDIETREATSTVELISDPVTIDLK